jgi:PAS domain S-box-containing protein
MCEADLPVTGTPHGVERGEGLRAYFEAALDCVIVADASGRVVEFNPAAERTFGYSRDEALGRTLAELIVPPSLRELHSNAFARFVEMREKRLFGQRLELTGMRANGSEFPVELALSCVESDPLLVCGALRDLTDVKRAEGDLLTLADEQAALRRVATLVADQAAPDVIFASVAEEIARILMADRCAVGRFEADDSMTLVAYWSNEEPKVPVGTRIGLQGDGVTAAVRESRRPILIDDHEAFSGPLMDYARTLGALPRSTVAAPIFVEGRVWGSIFASTMAVEIAEGTESRVVDFAELVATAIANTEARREVEQVANEQRALRTAATLVATGASPSEVFAAITTLASELFDVPFASLLRYGPDEKATMVAGCAACGGFVGQTWTIPRDDPGIVRTVVGSRRPARIEDHRGVHGPLGEAARSLGIGSVVGVPVVVDDSVWGVLAVGAAQDGPPLPADASDRLVGFTELVTTTLINAETRDSLRRLADEQAALRRVATLAARESSPAEVLEAVAEEAARVLEVDAIGMLRFEPDQTATLVAQSETPWDPPPLGTSLTLEGENIIAWVHRTGQAARTEGWESATGSVAEMANVLGVRSTVASPIVVEGRLWGTMVAATNQSNPLPADTESRTVEFTELLATAIANAESREALIASRARIVAAGDEARRRIERNLHDGTQQRLVALGLDVETARESIPADQQEAQSGLERNRHELEAVLEDVRELSHGLHPALLSQAGLGPSLRALARRSPIPVKLDFSVSERPSESTETAVYYVISEALANAAKHARASEISVVLTTAGTEIRAIIEDDGSGGAEVSAGSGLVGLIDRVEALGGRFALHSPPGHGTRISIEMPLTAEPIVDVARVPGGRRITPEDGAPPPLELSQLVDAATLHAAVAASADALYIVDPRGRIRFLNRAALRILGYEDERQLLGRPSHDTIHYLRPDGTPFPAAQCPLLRPRMSGETVRVDDDWFVRQDGSLVAVAYSSGPVPLEDGRGAVVSFRDISKHRTPEEEAEAPPVAQSE